MSGLRKEEQNEERKSKTTGIWRISDGYGNPKYGCIYRLGIHHSIIYTDRMDSE